MIEELNNVKTFGYVQCDKEFPKKLWASFVKFFPIFKNILDSKNEIRA